MFVKYIKDHPVGIKKGLCVHTENGHGKSLIASGFVEEIKEKEYSEYISKAKKVESDNVAKVTKEQKGLILKAKLDSEKAEKKRIEDEENKRSLLEKQTIEREFEKFKPLVSKMIKEALKK